MHNAGLRRGSLVCAINYFLLSSQGLIALGFKEHTDFELVMGEVVPGGSGPLGSSGAAAGADISDPTGMLGPRSDHSQRSLVRIDVFRDHRQTVQYITPDDVAFARQAELLVIDEAAAIPLPVVKNLFGPYFVFLSSTVNGYEGTGRALSLKLIRVIKRRNCSFN